MGWFSLLARVVPWGTVIDTAPQVLKAARGMLRKQRDGAPPPADEPGDAQALQRLQPQLASADWQWLQTLVQRVQQLERAHCQSLNLLEQLAEQNAAVVTTMGGLRTGVRRLAWTCAVQAAILLGLLLIYLLRA